MNPSSLLACARNVLLAALILVSIQGCASTHAFALPEDRAAISAVIRIGESVEVTQTDGTAKRFRVTRVDDQSICGEPGCLDYGQINTIRTERFSLAKTTGSIAAVWAVMAVGAAASVGSLL